MNVPQKGVAPPISEPEEFDPVKLYWLASQQFHWKLDDFSEVFGWARDTIYKWLIKKCPPSKQAKIRAATLKKEWGL